MSWLQVVVLSVLQGLTEFLPVSSSGHLRIFSTWLFGTDAGASFTAVIQLGTEAAVLVYFFGDIVRIVRAWTTGVFRPARRDDPDYRLGWFVIVGSVPISLIGFLGKDVIREGLRNLWITAVVLVAFSAVFVLAERVGRQDRPVDGRSLDGLTMKDAVVMGLAQCLALVPGVSRSGGTISAGLFLHMSRAAAARFSFFLAIPAVLASGLFSLPDAFDPANGQAASGAQLVVGTLIAFALGYAAIAWLLRFVEHHSLTWFAGYRVVLGLFVMVLLATGTVPAS